MNVFRGDAADELWRRAFGSLVTECRAPQRSRGGATYELLHCGLELTDPRQRWVVSRQPAINPAFAIAELVWILAGSNDAAVLNFWNHQLPTYAGATSTYPGAYGYRLRKHFGVDQIWRAVAALRTDPDSRQVVLQLWDPAEDLPSQAGIPSSCDVPCNVTSLLKLRNGRLHWTQIMRSNDIVRGFPYNLVQFTSLQEIIAGWLGADPGLYTHWSDSLHLYEADRVHFTDSVRDHIPNNESLAVAADDGELLIQDMYRRLVLLTERHLARQDFESLSKLDSMPRGYRSLMSVLLAEAARRRSWMDLMSSAEERCTNDQLRHVWELWKTERPTRVRAKA